MQRGRDLIARAANPLLLGPPDDEKLLEFVARFVGWYPEDGLWWIDSEDGAERYFNVTHKPPDYLNNLNAWHEDVWPRLQLGVTEAAVRYMDGDMWAYQLYQVCGPTAGQCAHLNASAKMRCLALWYTYDGILPGEKDDANGAQDSDRRGADAVREDHHGPAGHQFDS